MSVPGNLPLQLTSFVGREAAIAEVKRLLGTTRLLTLTGAGGCGKSRLALRIGEDVLRAYADGAWLVELAALSDPTLIPQTVATALGVREAAGRLLLDLLTDYLRGRSLLLILDNCEHLVAACAQLAEALLRVCPGLTILATGRHVLGVPGETAWRVPSLALPDLQSSPPLERLTHYEAVQLFIDRATAAQPSLQVTHQNAPAVAQICHQLDGIPLAIELAAARARVFSVEQIAARLDDRFHLLTSGPRTTMPRQQSLRATVDWSYDLLSEPERALLGRLSVFAGGWTFEAAESVAAGDGVQPYAVLDLLAQLVDKSLVIAEERRSAVRYRLLETIRQYACDRLHAVGKAEGTRDRHLAYFLALAEEAEPKLRGVESQPFLDRLEEEHANLRAALEWALASPDGGDAALRMSGALAWFWWLRSYHDEGWRWLERALAGTPDASAARMKALHGAGFLAHHRRDSALARALLGESLAIARARDDRWTVAWVLHGLGRVAYYDDDPATAHALGEESLAVAEVVGDRWLIAWALHLLGLAAHIAADYPTARDYYARSLAIRRELGYQEGISILLGLLGAVAVREGDLGRAHALLGESLAAARAVQGPWGLAMILAGISHIAAALGQPLRAVRLAAAAAARSDAYHTPLIPLFDALLWASRPATADTRERRTQDMTTSLNDAAVEAFRADFRGELIRPGDETYDKARSLFNGMIDRRPALIARPTGTADVIAAVKLARESGLPLAVRCGGHSLAGNSVCDDGLVIDLSRMKGLRVDPAARTARANAGVLWGEFDRETQLFGLATPGGRVTTTGLGGFTLGGGYGWLSPEFGLTCDNLISADVVTADGRLVTASERENADLFWGLRGGGGNFGVVTSYEYRLHPLGPLVMGGLLLHPIDRGEEVARAYRDYVESAPDKLATAIAVLMAPPAPFVPEHLQGKPVFGIVVLYAGAVEEAEAAVAPLKRLGPPAVDLVQPMPYTAFQALLDPSAPWGLHVYSRALHLQGLSDGAIDTLLEYGAEIAATSPWSPMIIFRHGGAVARVPDDATAFSHRGAAYMAHPIAGWEDAADTDRHLDWVKRFSAAMRPFGTGGVYLNLEADEGEDKVRANFSAEKYAKLDHQLPAPARIGLNRRRCAQ